VHVSLNTAADGADTAPGVRIGKCPGPERSGGLAHPLRGAHRRISKGCDKGVIRNKFPCGADKGSGLRR
jgi:hypothetical protein